MKQIQDAINSISKQQFDNAKNITQILFEVHNDQQTMWKITNIVNILTLKMIQFETFISELFLIFDDLFHKKLAAAVTAHTNFTNLWQKTKTVINNQGMKIPKLNLEWLINRKLILTRTHMINEKLNLVITLQIPTYDKKRKDSNS